MTKIPARYNLKVRYAGWQNRQRISRLARQTAENSPQGSERGPVLFFNVSTRLTGLSLNAAFSLLTSWSLRLAGTPVKHFVCQSGMSHCILGTNRQDFRKAPPCQACIAQSQRLYSGANTHWFEHRSDPKLSTILQGLSVDELTHFEYPLAHDRTHSLNVPLGRLVLPSIRWALRRHSLQDDEDTRYLLREYMLSAYNIAQEFADLIEEAQPSSAVIFNGTMYPEATARWVAQQHDLRVVTHEVSFQPFSAFFTTGEATAYPLKIPDAFELTSQQNARLDAYLEERFQGKFTMAGIRFWPEMSGLDEAFLRKTANFRQLVPVFTNVVYDTSQVHANQVFPHMFAWLDLILEVIKEHPDTFFVIRAHPDEMRPGTAKQSRESVRDWVYNNAVNTLPNVVFIDSQEYISSYELIQRAKFIIVYNSSIGLEAALMKTAVLCGGKARFTQYPTVYYPDTPQAYRDMAHEFLAEDGGGQQLEKTPIPPEYERNARRFLYYQLFRASLPFGDYLEEGKRMGFVQLRDFPWPSLLPENSTTMRILRDGILGQTPESDQDTPTFLLGEVT